MNIGFFDSIFGSKPITEERINDFLSDVKTKRICFSRIQKHALWKTEDGKDMLTLPFDDSVGVILKEHTGIALRKSSKGKYYRELDDKEIEEVKSFINSYSDVVFLRDLLDSSVALSMNFEEDGETHTYVGGLEKRAKYDKSEEDLRKLADIVDEFIGKTPLYANADLICAVPPSKVGDENIPARVIGKLTNFKGVDISKSVRWTSKTASLKNAEGADKLEILNHSGFEIVEGTDVKGKDIVLVDDLYMSGITLQYVAMKLKEAGAGRVYGLCCVKSFGNK